MDFATYLHTLRRRWLIVVGAALLGVGIAAGIAATAGKVYRATASVVVAVNGATSVSDLSSGSTYLTSAMPTYAALGTSSLLLDPVIQSQRLDMSADDLADHVSVSQTAQTYVLDVAATDSDPKVATKIAQGVADELGVVIPNLSKAGTSKGTTTPPGISVTTLSKATQPSSPASPSWPLHLLVGLFSGLLVGCVLAVATELGARRRLHRLTFSDAEGGRRGTV